MSVNKIVYKNSQAQFLITMMMRSLLSKVVGSIMMNRLKSRF